MKQNLHIQLLKQYILEKHGRPFEEVVAYQKHIGATDQDLELALLSLKNQREQMAKKLKPVKVSFLPPVNKKHAAIGASFSLILLFSLALSLQLNQQPTRTTAKAQPAQVKPISKIAIPFIPKEVYASQKTVDAKRVFSYPKSNISLLISGTPKREVFGFLPYWMLDEQDKISLDGYTSISLFGLEADGKGNIVTGTNESPDPGWAMWNDPRLQEIVTKAKRKKIKTYLTVKAFDQGNIEKIVTSDESQKTLIANIIQLVNVKSLDGVNLDFEYVGEADKKVADGFTRFVANLNSELKRQYPNSQLTVDTYASSGSSSDFFDIALLEPNIDSFIIMGYDIHVPSGAPGPVAPLEGEAGLLGYLQSYLERVPAKKIILALPYYGYDWPIKENINQDEVKIIPYAEIAANIKDQNLQWDQTSQTPFYEYVENGQKRQVHFDNARSLSLKYDLINSKDLKGVGIWAMGYDGLNQELQQLIFDKFTK